ncbi:MAG: hypothetical protein HC907_35050 [Richelia sp. SM1_7_0]|nr:hypothetical protein [Richelia sp. SM1_7_0]
MSLLNECIEALGDNANVLSNSDTELIFSAFEDAFPITKWARIDWDKIDEKIKFDSSSDILSYLRDRFSPEDLDKHFYILWDNASLPTIKVKLEQILNAIDDVTAVSFDTWIFSPELGYVIEFYHEGEITIGIVSNSM